MYIVRIVVYEKEVSKEETYSCYIEALAAYTLASEIVSMLWTRHYNVTNEVTFFDERKNVFNEGHVFLET